MIVMVFATFGTIDSLSTKAHHILEDPGVERHCKSAIFGFFHFDLASMPVNCDWQCWQVWE